VDVKTGYSSVQHFHSISSTPAPPARGPPQQRNL